MSKADLIRKAQPLADKSFTMVGSSFVGEGFFIFSFTLTIFGLW
jgi:hypothetical protein